MTYTTFVAFIVNYQIYCVARKVNKNSEESIKEVTKFNELLICQKGIYDKSHGNYVFHKGINLCLTYERVFVLKGHKSNFILMSIFFF